MDKKDYLHFYLHQRCIVSGSVSYQHPDGEYFITPNLLDEALLAWFEVKPILRPLSDMSDAEFKEWDKYSDNADDKFNYAYEMFAAQTAYLLEKGFDVFGLKEKGLAIYKTDVK